MMLLVLSLTNSFRLIPLWERASRPTCEASRVAGRVRGESFLTRLRRIPLTALAFALKQKSGSASNMRARALPQGESGECVALFRPGMRAPCRGAGSVRSLTNSPLNEGVARRKTQTYGSCLTARGRSRRARCSICSASVPAFRLGHRAQVGRRPVAQHPSRQPAPGGDS